MTQLKQQTYTPPQLTSRQTLDGLHKLSQLPKSDRQDIISGIQVLPKGTRAKTAIYMALRWKVS